MGVLEDFMLNDAEDTDESDFIDTAASVPSLWYIVLILSAIYFFERIHISLEKGTGFPCFDLPADIGMKYT